MGDERMNYMQIKSDMLYHYFLYIDGFADASLEMLKASGIKYKVIKEYVKDDFPYRLYITRIRKADKKAFDGVMKRLTDRMLLGGRADYLDACQEVFSIIEAGEKKAM